MTGVIDQLQWATMTRTVNLIKSPNTFLRRRLVTTEETLTTETIEIDTLSGDRVAAPFVKRNGQSIMVPGRGFTRQQITAPNIRLSRPLDTSELLFGRAPGSIVFPSGQEIASQINLKIARELAVLSDMVTEREEWMIAMALRGAISYSVEGGDHFDITFARDSAQDAELVTATEWDAGASSNPWNDFDTAKRLISESVSLGVTDVILGTNADAAFMKHTKVLAQINTQSGLGAGTLALSNQYRDDGAILRGVFGGVAVWYYPRTVSADGSTVKLIRDDYAEFIAASPAAEFTMYYAAISDAKALQGRNFVGQRFSKSWIEEDPSGWIALLASRPLPVLRKPNATMSLKVTNV